MMMEQITQPQPQPRRRRGLSPRSGLMNMNMNVKDGNNLSPSKSTKKKSSKKIKANKKAAAAAVTAKMKGAAAKMKGNTVTVESSSPPPAAMPTTPLSKGSIASPQTISPSPARSARSTSTSKMSSLSGVSFLRRKLAGSKILASVRSSASTSSSVQKETRETARTEHTNTTTRSTSTTQLKSITNDFFVAKTKKQRHLLAEMDMEKSISSMEKSINSRASSSSPTSTLGIQQSPFLVGTAAAAAQSTIQACFVDDRSNISHESSTGSMTASDPSSPGFLGIQNPSQRMPQPHPQGIPSTVTSYHTPDDDEETEIVFSDSDDDLDMSLDSFSSQEEEHESVFKTAWSVDSSASRDNLEFPPMRSVLIRTSSLVSLEEKEETTVPMMDSYRSMDIDKEATTTPTKKQAPPQDSTLPMDIEQTTPATKKVPPTIPPKNDVTDHQEEPPAEPEPASLDGRTHKKKKVRTESNTARPLVQSGCDGHGPTPMAIPEVLCSDRSSEESNPEPKGIVIPVWLMHKPDHQDEPAEPEPVSLDGRTHKKKKVRTESNTIRPLVQREKDTHHHKPDHQDKPPEPVSLDGRTHKKKKVRTESNTIRPLVQREKDTHHHKPDTHKPPAHDIENETATTPPPDTKQTIPIEKENTPPTDSKQAPPTIPRNDDLMDQDKPAEPVPLDTRSDYGPSHKIKKVRIDTKTARGPPTKKVLPTIPLKNYQDKPVPLDDKTDHCNYDYGPTNKNKKAPFVQRDKNTPDTRRPTAAFLTTQTKVPHSSKNELLDQYEPEPLPKENIPNPDHNNNNVDNGPVQQRKTKAVITESSRFWTKMPTKSPEQEATAQGSSTEPLQKSHKKIYILLLQPASKMFELIQVRYAVATTTVGDILDMIPPNATEVVLGSQRYTGLASSPTAAASTAASNSHKSKGSEPLFWTDFDMPASSSWINQKHTADIHDGDILVAIPEGYTAPYVTGISKYILSNPRIQELLVIDQTNANTTANSSPTRVSPVDGKLKKKKHKKKRNSSNRKNKRLSLSGDESESANISKRSRSSEDSLSSSSHTSSSDGSSSSSQYSSNSSTEFATPATSVVNDEGVQRALFDTAVASTVATNSSTSSYERLLKKQSDANSSASSYERLPKRQSGAFFQPIGSTVAFKLNASAPFATYPMKQSTSPCQSVGSTSSPFQRVNSTSTFTFNAPAFNAPTPIATGQGVLYNYNLDPSFAGRFVPKERHRHSAATQAKYSSWSQSFKNAVSSGPSLTSTKRERKDQFLQNVLLGVVAVVSLMVLRYLLDPLGYAARGTILSAASSHNFGFAGLVCCSATFVALTKFQMLLQTNVTPSESKCVFVQSSVAVWERMQKRRATATGRR